MEFQLTCCYIPFSPSFQTSVMIHFTLSYFLIGKWNDVISDSTIYLKYYVLCYKIQYLSQHFKNYKGRKLYVHNTISNFSWKNYIVDFYSWFVKMFVNGEYQN